VGFEGDGEGGVMELAGACYDFGENALVAAVDAIEVADGGDGGAEVFRDFGEAAIDVHEAGSGAISK
jgi:hypothetical protein